MSYILLHIKATVFLRPFFNLIQGVAALSIEEPKQASEESNACVKEEKCEIDKQLVIYQATDLAAAENLLTTPSMVECRFVCQLSCIFAHLLLESYLLCRTLSLRHFLLPGPWLVFHPQAPRNQAPRSQDPQRNLEILLGCAILKLL